MEKIIEIYNEFLQETNEIIKADGYDVDELKRMEPSMWANYLKGYIDGAEDFLKWLNDKYK